MKKFKILALFIALAFIISAVSCVPGIPRGGNIALIRLNGTIAEAPQFGIIAGGITPKQVKEYLERAEKDEAIKAVVLRINSPGGSAAASQEIGEMIKRFEKPVVISMADTAASGGYYISAHADWIVAQPATTTGSIGVIALIMDVSGLMDKLGIKPEIIKSGKYKDILFGFRPLTDEERQILKELCNDAYEDFIKAVVEGRGLEIERVRELATGQVYTGEQAKKLGLVDQLGGLKTALDKAAELAGITKPKVVEYQPPTPWWQKLFGGLISKNFSFSSEHRLFLQALKGWNGVICYQ